MFSLKLFLRPRVSKIGLLSGTSTRSSQNRLEPATTEKLVYVYSNSKMVVGTSDANELKMLAWAVHLMKMHSCNVTASDLAAHRPAGGSQPGRDPSRRVAESPTRRRVAQFSQVAESLVADSANRAWTHPARGGPWRRNLPPARPSRAESRVAVPRLGVTRPTRVFLRNPSLACDLACSVCTDQIKVVSMARIEGLTRPNRIQNTILKVGMFITVHGLQLNGVNSS